MRLYFIDPDLVEEKNLIRQNFCPAEVGQPKAFTLAWRYTAAFGLNIIPVIKPFAAEMLKTYQPRLSPQGTLTIVVGAVDNVCARRDIAQAITHRLGDLQQTRDKLWWLDAGNERLNGQVLIGNSLETEPLLSPLGYCTALPLPHLQEPSLLQDRPRPESVDLSCAELTALGEQSAMVNRAMATWLGVYLYRLLQSRDLDLMATFLNLRTGTTRSASITDGRIVLPERPRSLWQGIEATSDEADDRCPQCGAEVIAGEDEWQGVLIQVRFCTACPWREDLCPQCGGEIDDDEAEVEGQVVPVIRCWDCDWQEVIPNAHD